MKRASPWLLRVFILIALSRVGISPRQIGAQESQPVEVVEKLYQEVVLRHPLGVPSGSAKTAIWPLLSTRLIKVFETRSACDRDWDRKHGNANPPEKAPGFYEDGLFSGANEMGFINGAAVGQTQTRPDSSYLVDVKVWSYFDDGVRSLRTHKKYRWRVAARVISENGRFVVDDILGFKGVFDPDKAVYMSNMLPKGCKGTHTLSN